MTTDRPGRASTEGPLSGVRVLDLSRVIMGPFASQILADQGADVILIEADGADANRVMGPGPHPELSGIALNLLRNKRSVKMDLKSAEGIDFVHRLVETCDVVVTTIRPHVLKRLGLDYDALSAVRPDLVYCQAQGYRLDGPRADDPAFDDVIQAATGVCDLTARVWGEPVLMPTIFADKVCGIVMAQAVSAALYSREKTGRGQHIEVPMQQAMSAFMLAEHGSGAIPEPPTRQGEHPAAGYPRLLSPERRPHPTKDGLVHLFPYLPKHYVSLFTEAGVPDAEHDPRYVDQRATLVHSESLYRDVRLVASTRTTAEWLEYCGRAGIPASAVATLQEMVDELPLAEHPTVGSYRVIPQMAVFNGAPGALRLHAPLIGEHTDAIVAELAGTRTGERFAGSPGSGGSL